MKYEKAITHSHTSRVYSEHFKKSIVSQISNAKAISD